MFDTNDKKRFEKLESSKSIFINKFVGCFFRILEHKENVGIKEETPQTEGFYKRSAQGLNIVGTVAAPIGDGVAAGFGVPAPVGSSAKVVTDIGGGVITYFGKRAANKKTKKFLRFIEQNERYELETLLNEAAKDLAIAYEYQISHLENKIDIERLASTAANLLAIHLNKSENQQILLTRAIIIQGIIETAYTNRLHRLVKFVKGDERAKNMKLDNNLGDSWHSMELLTKTGLLTKDLQCKAKEEGCDIEKFSFRRELLPELDGKYSRNVEINEKEVRGYNGCVNTWYVTLSDLIDFDQTVKNGKIEKDKSFNSYISEKYASGQPVIAVFRNCKIPEGYNLDNLNFSESYFIDVDFSKVSLKGTNLTEAYMPKVKFIEADLTGAILINAYLVRGDFEKAIINGTEFAGADLTCAKLKKITQLNDQTDFTNIKRAGVDYSGTELDQAKMDIGLYDIIKENKKLEQKLNKFEQRYNEQFQQKEKHDLDTKEEIERLNLKVRKLKKQLLKVDEEKNVYANGEIYIGPKIIGKLNGGSNFVRLSQALKQETIVVILSSLGSDATQLARYYAHYYLEQEFSKVVFEIDASTLDSLNASYRQFATSLDVVKYNEELKFKSIEEIQKLVLEELSQEYRTGYLLIISNINKPEVKTEIKSYLPQSNGNIIVTTQDNTLPLFLNAASLPLSEWSKEEACLYIIKKLKNKNIKIDLAQIELVAERLNYLPLGIDIATLYIKNKNITIEEYIKRLNGKLSAEAAGQDTLKAVITLTINDLNTVERNILQFCSLLAANSIPIKLLKSYIQNMYPQFNEKKCEIILNSGIEVLSKYSLIAGIEGRGDNRYIYLHQTIQEVLKQYLITEEHQQNTYIEQLCNILIKFVSRDNNSNEKFKTNWELLLHIESIILNVNKYKIELTPNLAYLQVCIAVFYDFIGEHKKAINLLDPLIKQIENIIQVAKLLEGTITYFELDDIIKPFLTIYGQVLYHLGRACFNESLDNDISEACFTQAVKVRKIIDEAIKNEDLKEIDRLYNEGTPKAMDSIIFKRNGLYLWYNLKGYKEKNQRLLTKAIEGYQSLVDEESKEPNNLKDKFNLGICLVGIADSIFKLAKLQFQAQEEYIETCSKGLSFILTHLKNGLGIQIEQQEDINLEDLFNKLESYVRTTNATRVAREYDLIGRILALREQNEEGLIYAEKFLKRAKELDNGKSYLTGNALFGLAFLYSRKPDYLDTAKKYLLECREVRVRFDPKMLFETEELEKQLKLSKSGKTAANHLQNIILDKFSEIHTNLEAEQHAIILSRNYEEADIKNCLEQLHLKEGTDYNIVKSRNGNYEVSLEDSGYKKLEIKLEKNSPQLSRH